MSDSSNQSIERLREQVIEQLSSGYSNDYLSETEFEERVEKATGAATHQELRSLILDIPVVSSPNPPVPTSQTGNLPVAVNDGAVEAESTMLAVFSGSSRKGVWSPPRVLNSISVFGGSDIDLREASIPAGGMTIHAIACFGGVDIIVPEGANVRVNGAGVFGGFDGKSYPGEGPEIKIDGVAFFGGVDVKMKRRK